MSNIKLFSSFSNIALEHKIIHRLEIQFGNVDVSKLNNGEISVEIKESVRGQDVYIMQCFHEDVNDQLMELLLLIQACKLDAASRVTAVIPYFPYSKQDQKKNGTSISAKLVANMLTVSGADRIISVDLHSPQIEGFFDIPVDNLPVEAVILEWIKENIPEWSESCIISPDAGGTKRVTSIANNLKVGFAIIHEKRQDTDISSMVLLGDVRYRTVIIIDDMADSCDTLVNAAKKLKEAGAGKVYAIVTHGIFSGSATSVISDAPFEAVATTNTIPQEQHMIECPKIHCIDIFKVLADAIHMNH